MFDVGAHRQPSQSASRMTPGHDQPRFSDMCTANRCQIRYTRPACASSTPVTIAASVLSGNSATLAENSASARRQARCANRQGFEHHAYARRDHAADEFAYELCPRGFHLPPHRHNRRSSLCPHSRRRAISPSPCKFIDRARTQQAMPAVSTQLRRVAISIGERKRSIEAALRSHPTHRLQLPACALPVRPRQQPAHRPRCTRLPAFHAARCSAIVPQGAQRSHRCLDAAAFAVNAAAPSADICAHLIAELPTSTSSVIAAPTHLRR